MSDSSTDNVVNIHGDAKGSAIIAGDHNIVHVSSPTPANEPNPFGVPYQRNSYFTGRESLLRQLHIQFTQPTKMTKLHVISGLGGIGKTQMAVEYAYRYHYDQPFYRTVFWVKADSPINLATDFADMAYQLALPVGLQDSQATQRDKILAVQTWLNTHNNWLLIFDNADTPDWLTPYIPTNPQGKVLVTSRASVFDHIGIRAPLALDVLCESEALSLLFERTGYEQTEANRAAARQISQELDGLPLALEQASAFMVRRQTTLDTYLKTYRKRGLTQLEKEKAKTGQYPSSVMKTWTINIDAVTSENPAAAALLEMSAFLAPEDIPYRLFWAGVASLGTVLNAYLSHEGNEEEDVSLALSDLLALLSQYSLVRWVPARQCYSVHRLVQAVVRDVLNPVQVADYLEGTLAALAAAYPGSDFTHWKICTQLGMV